MKKYLLFALLLFPFLFIACGDDDNDTPTPIVKENKVYNFIFNEKYTVTDINYYVGPKGEKKDLSEEAFYEMYPDLWGNIKKPLDTQIIIDLDKDSVSCKSEFSTVNYKASVRADSVFAYYIGNGVEFFMGTLNKTKTEFTVYIHYSTKTLQERPDEGLYGGYIFSKKSDYGISGYNNNFISESIRYSSPEDLTKEGDEILWANYQYSFSLKEDR